MKAFYPEYSWTVQKIDEKFYWFNEQGIPYGPFDASQTAFDALHDYENDFEESETR